jgi:maleate isomerase
VEFLSPSKWRASWGLVVPAQNTAVEADFWHIAPHGITFHSGRVPFADWKPKDAEDGVRLQNAFSSQIDTPEGRRQYEDTVRTLVGMHPDRIVFPISAVSMRKGLAGAEQMKQDLEEWSGGVPVTLGAHAILQALGALKAKRVGLLSPYGTGAQKEVGNFLVEAGYSIGLAHALELSTADRILMSSEPEGVLELIMKVDGPDIDVVLQSGANMSIPGLIEEAEQRLQKPFLAMNPTILWSAMRSSGFDDQFESLGALWREH